MTFTDKRGRVSLLKGVVIRKIILCANFVRCYLKIHTLVPYFECSTATAMLIGYNRL